MYVSDVDSRVSPPSVWWWGSWQRPLVRLLGVKIEEANSLLHSSSKRAKDLMYCRWFFRGLHPPAHISSFPSTLKQSPAGVSCNNPQQIRCYFHHEIFTETRSLEDLRSPFRPKRQVWGLHRATEIWDAATGTSQLRVTTGLPLTAFAGGYIRSPWGTVVL